MTEKYKKDLVDCFTKDLNEAKPIIAKRFKFTKEQLLTGEHITTITDYIEQGMDLKLINGYEVYLETSTDTFEQTIVLIMFKR